MSIITQLVTALIRFKRGNKADLPSLNQGEPALCTDTEDFYIGGISGNIHFRKSPFLHARSYGVVPGMTDATSVLKTAIESAHQRKLFIPNGVYNISKIDLDGIDVEIVCEENAIFNMIDGTNDNMFVVTNSSRFLFENGTIDCSGNPGPSVGGVLGFSFENCDNVHLENVEIKNVLNYGVQFSQVTNSMIRKCSLSECGIALRLVHNSDNNKIVNNVVENCAGGIFLYSEEDPAKQCKNNEISGNYIKLITELNLALGHAAGISVYDAPHSTIKDNTLITCLNRGIYVFVGSDYSVVENNYLEDIGFIEPTAESKGTAIDMDMVNHCVAIGNIVNGCYGAGFFLSGNVRCAVKGNILKDCGKGSATVNVNNKPACSAIVMNEGGGDGSYPFVENIIEGNITTDVTGFCQYGLVQWLGNDEWYARNIINNNSARNMQVQDFSLKGSTSDIVYGNLETNNTFATLKTKSISTNVTPPTTTDITVTDEMDLILANSAFTATQTVTLPDSTLRYGRKFTIKKIDANNTVSVVGTGGQTIDGSASYDMTANNAFVTVQSNGTTWYTVAKG